MLTLLTLFFICSCFFNCENKIDSEILNLEAEILASREFTEFMNHHAGWQLRNTLARVENIELLDKEELETLQTEFITKSNYSLNTEAGNTLLKGFDFDSMKEFITYYNSFENKKHALHEKFPQLGTRDGLFIKLQREYIAQLEFSDIYLKVVSTRDDIPGSVFTSFVFPQCTFNTEDCPNFELNGCDEIYRECVLEEQQDWIGGQNPNGSFTGLRRCWGDEFIFIDYQLDQECQYDIFGELHCLNDPPNVAGLQGVVYLLVGGGSPDSGGPLDCVAAAFRSYEIDVCLPCQNIECECF